MPDLADDMRSLYRGIRVLGVAAVVIMLAGLVDYLYFEPPGQNTGVTARLRGVYAYDPASHRTQGAPASQFPRDEPFAGVVDWASLPPGLVVVARWYDSFGQLSGSVGPAPAGKLAGRPTVPVSPESQTVYTLPGHYVFVVERYAGGRPVEVLARSIVRVLRG